MGNSYEIQSVFSKWLGRRAREMAAQDEITIIEIKDFPEGAPIHEDGSATYHPRKPLVLFAVQLVGAAQIRKWNEVLREFDQMRGAA